MANAFQELCSVTSPSSLSAVDQPWPKVDQGSPEIDGRYELREIDEPEALSPLAVAAGAGIPWSPDILAY